MASRFSGKAFLSTIQFRETSECPLSAADRRLVALMTKLREWNSGALELGSPDLQRFLPKRDQEHKQAIRMKKSQPNVGYVLEPSLFQLY